MRLEGFVLRYAPEIGALARAAIARLRKRLPKAVQLVYDNYNTLVVGFGPSERASEAILSIALYPRSVTLFFLQGARLADPERLLKGSGKIVRHVVLGAASDLDKPAIRDLIAQALALSGRPFPGPGRLVIRSVSAKQRPRRPPRPLQRGPAG